MARTTPVNSGYTIINGITTGSNGSKVDTWLEYKVLSQSASTNTSTVRVILYSQSTVSSSTKWDVAERFGYVGYDNGNKEYLSTTYDFSNNKINKFGDATYTIGHNPNGQKTVTMQGAWSTTHSTYISGGSASASVTLPTIPRYATVTQSLTARTETAITMNWASDSVIDFIWYSKNNGSTWTGVNVADGTKGTYTIEGLSANTSYTIKTRVRRKDSQLTTDSVALQVTTYAFPYATSMPNFTIGTQLTIGLFNPLGRQVSVSLIGNDNSVIGTIQTISTSISGYNGSSAVDGLYASIPNSKSGTYKVRVTYNSNVDTKTGGTYSVNTNVCMPSIRIVDYNDMNDTTIELTGDDADIVQNISTVSFFAWGVSALKFASITACSVSVNGNVHSLTLSGSVWRTDGITIDSGTDVDAVFTATDTRGLTASKTITVSMLPWHTPSAIISLQRQHNYYSETDITVDADYSSINDNNEITITYQATKDGDSSPSFSGTLQDNVQSTLNLNNEYGWTVSVTLTDLLGGSATYTMFVSRGMPIIYFDRLKSSVGINCFPQNNKSLEVNGYDLTYHAGETITLDGFVVGGVLTNAGSRLLFSIPLPKFISNLNVSVTALKANVWVASGGYAIGGAYITGGYDFVADSTITIIPSIATGNMLHLRLDKTSAFNGTNNTPISVQIGTLTIAFTS